MWTNTPPTYTSDPIPPVLHRRTPGWPPKSSAERRGILPSPVVVVVSNDSLLRWALHEGLAAAQMRVLVLSDEAHVREILPKIGAEPAVLVIDDESWPITQGERDSLYARWPCLPILLLAHPRWHLEHRVNELGVDEVLLKPFDLSHLVQTVERLIAAPVRAAHRAHHAAAL